jgi:hypothetical protein
LGSNLKKAIKKGFKISENISQMKVSGDFYDKQKLQYLRFPKGCCMRRKKTLFEPEESTPFSAKSPCWRGIQGKQKRQPFARLPF